MKSLKDIEKELTPEEIAESYVFPGTKDKKEREQALDAYRDFRKKITSKQSAKSKLIAELLQLKFLIEDYIATDTYNAIYHFGYFLKEYISRIERNNKEFAGEIDVAPTELSQVINKHRRPTEKLIFRLELHSNRNFPALLWFKILEKERAYELKHDKRIIDSEKKHVKKKLEFSI